MSSLFDTDFVNDEYDDNDDVSLLFLRLQTSSNVCLSSSSTASTFFSLPPPPAPPPPPPRRLRRGCIAFSVSGDCSSDFPADFDESLEDLPLEDDDADDEGKDMKSSVNGTKSTSSSNWIDPCSLRLKGGGGGRGHRK